MPREIQAQERYTESMLRPLPKNSNDTQHLSDAAQRQEVVAWIFIVVLGLVSVFALYILYLKASGNCSSVAYSSAELVNARCKTGAGER